MDFCASRVILTGVEGGSQAFTNARSSNIEQAHAPCIFADMLDCRGNGGIQALPIFPAENAHMVGRLVPIEEPGVRAGAGPALMRA